MMIVICNSKGGVGKSTLAAHLVLWAHSLRIKTALIDTDKQRSSSQWIAEAEPTIVVRVATTPEECLKEATELRKSHDIVVGDGPAGLDDISRTLLILADLAILPLTPSILDLRSVQQATDVLKFAQGINGGRPEGRIVLNKMKTRDSISKELSLAAQKLGVQVAKSVIRDLQAYRDAAGQATSVSFLGKKAQSAADDIDALFRELLDDKVDELVSMTLKKEVANG
ncbi:MAG: AAA family ATPase [Pirellulaceae bacterium]|nr:AAA family ATPase [Pirellulaceae bacterium]